ncbi:MAG TPA: gamma-glutamyl-gamma-aminobutyrate hydrolase family protein [Magnetospirillum sp.]|nr:gamma-glutamyl-gamma-aminobutyrate hydrolase family protein [Magnetospirillum sp.]
MNILVTQRVDLSDIGERRDALDQRWAAVLAAIGAVAIPVPNLPAQAVPLAESVAAAGVLLSGGNDLGAAPERDATETALVDWALARDLPVLGVCRGMQFLAVRFGAALVELSGHVARRHRVSAGGRAFEVNSYHRFGLAALPYGLIPLATADDGSIEAFRHQSLPVAAMMWHPEREQPPEREALALIRTFFTTRRFDIPCAH